MIDKNAREAGLLKKSVDSKFGARQAAPLQDFMRCVGALLAAPVGKIDFFSSPGTLADPEIHSTLVKLLISLYDSCDSIC